MSLCTLDPALSTVSVAGTVWTLLNGNLEAKDNVNMDHQIIARAAASAGVSTGKYYCEVLCNAVRNDQSNAVIVCAANDPANSRVNAPGFYMATGNVYDSTVSGAAFPAITATHKLCVAVDVGGLLWWCRIDGGNWWNSGTPNPATGTGGHALASTRPFVMGVYVGGSGGSPNADWTFNFGATAYSFTAPSGFGNWPGPPTPGGGGNAGFFLGI